MKNILKSIKNFFSPSVVKRSLSDDELMKFRFKISNNAVRDFNILESQFLAYQKKYPFASGFKIIFKEKSQDYRFGVVWNADEVNP